jgi:hypothetical protein
MAMEQRDIFHEVLRDLDQEVVLSSSGGTFKKNSALETIIHRHEYG